MIQDFQCSAQAQPAQPKPKDRDREEEGEKKAMNERESTGTEAAPPSTVYREAPTPVRPGGGLLKLTARTRSSPPPGLPTPPSPSTHPTPLSNPTTGAVASIPTGPPLPPRPGPALHPILTPSPRSIRRRRRDTSWVRVADVNHLHGLLCLLDQQLFPGASRLLIW